MNLKQITILLMAILFATALSSQTTLEEYNYVTKGYKVQLESGLDMKKGYVLREIKNGILTSGQDKRKVTLKVLQKVEEKDQNQNPKVAAYMIIYQLNDLEKQYFCIPHPFSDPQVINSYIQSLYDGDEKVHQESRLQAILYVTSLALSWDSKVL